MIGADQAVAELVQDSAVHVMTHRVFSDRLTALAAMASTRVSAHDVGIALLELLGDEAKVDEFLAHHADAITRIFNQWNAAARLAAHERRQMK